MEQQQERQVGQPAIDPVSAPTNAAAPATIDSGASAVASADARALGLLGIGGLAVGATAFIAPLIPITLIAVAGVAALLGSRR